MTFNSNKEKGPPCSLYPILLAGTCKQYSKNATPQLISITANKPKLANFLFSLNFKCPYQAKVIKTLDATKSAIAPKPYIYLLYGYFFER